MPERSVVFHVLKELEKTFITNVILDKTHVINDKLHIFSNNQRINNMDALLIFDPYIYVVLSIMISHNKTIDGAIEFLKTVPVNSNIWPLVQVVKYKKYINNSDYQHISFDCLDTLGLIINKIKYIESLKKCKDISSKLTSNIIEKINSVYDQDFVKFNYKKKSVN
jgi:hypothetical protein